MNIGDQQQSQHHFELFFENSIDLLCIADNNGHFVKLNPQWETTLGYSLSELEGKPFIDFVHPDDIEETIRITSYLSLNNPVSSFTNRYRCKNGTYKWIEWRSYPANNMIYASARDITERKENEEALHLTETRYHLLFENMNSGFAFHEIVLDENKQIADVRILRINSKFKELWSSSDDILGKSIFSLSTRKTKEQFQDDWDKLCKGTPNSHISYIPEKDLYIESFEYKADETHFAVLFNDVSDRIRKEQILQESESRFRAITEYMPIALGVATLNGEIKYSNQKFEEYFGYQASEVKSVEHWMCLSHPDEEERKRVIELFKNDVKDVLDKKAQYGMPRVYTTHNKSGQVLQTEISFTIVGSEIYVIFNDITQRVAIEEQLRQKEQRLSKAQEIGRIGYDEIVIGEPLIWMSKQGLAIYGFSQQEGYIEAQKIIECSPEIARLRDFHRKVVTECVRNDIEYVIKPADGTPQRYVHVVTDIDKYVDGKPHKLISIFQDITERKLAEDALKKSIAQFNGIAQNIPGIIFQLCINTELSIGINYVSERSLEYLGIPSTESNCFLNAFLYEFKNKDGIQLVELIYSSVDSFSKFDYDCEYVLPNASNIYLRCLAQPRMLNEQIVFDGVILDISESVRAQKELSNTRAILATAFMQTPIPMVIVSTETLQINICNKASLQYLGLDEHTSPEGVSIRELTPSWQDFDENMNPIPLSEAPIVRALKGIEVKDYKYATRRHDGTMRWASVNTSVVRNSEGKPIAAFMAFPDITEQVEAELKIREWVQMHQTILDTVNAGLAFIKAGKHVWVNNSAGKMLGYDNPEDLIGVPIQSIFATFEEFEKTITDSQPYFARGDVYVSELRSKRIDGSIFWIRASGKALNQQSPGEGSVWMMQDITLQKQMLEALQESERNYRDIYNTSSDAIFIFEIENGHVVDVNEAVPKMYGFKTKEEVIGKTLNDLAPDIEIFTAKEASRKIQKAIDEGPQAFEWLAYNQSGYSFWTEVYLIITSIAGIQRAIASVRNINERKVAEAELQKNKAILTATMESISDGLLVVSSEGKVTHFNTRFTEIFELPDELIQTKDDTILLNYAKTRLVDPESFHKQVEQIYQTNDPTEDILLFANGNIIERLSFPLQEDSPVKGRVWVFRDITERKRDEENIRKKDEKLKGIFIAAPVAIGLIENNIYQECNDSFFNMTGYQPEDIIGNNASILTETNEFIRLRQEISIHDFENGPFKTESKWIRKNGQMMDIGLQLLPTSFNKDFNGYIFTALDITARKKAEMEILSLNNELEMRVNERTQQLEQVNKDLEAFAYSVSHDLRAPLRHIDGFIRLLYSGIPNPTDTINSHYQKINAATKRLSGMIDELLSFSRLGRKELQLTPVNLNKIVDEIIESIKSDCLNRKIVWTVDKLPAVNGDQALLRLAFENLISNAVKYTSKTEQTLIEIGLEKEDFQQVTIYVKDNGAGFDMAYINKLFGVFQRLHSNEEFEGIGIGLANVKQIVQKHKGSITALGEPNKGACFYVTLPKG